VHEPSDYSDRFAERPGEPPYVAFIRGGGIRVDVIAAQTDYQHTAIDRFVLFLGFMLVVLTAAVGTSRGSRCAVKHPKGPKKCRGLSMCRVGASSWGQA
jgi:hypothetical protein